MIVIVCGSEFASNPAQSLVGSEPDRNRPGPVIAHGLTRGRRHGHRAATGLDATAEPATAKNPVTSKQGNLDETSSHRNTLLHEGAWATKMQSGIYIARF